MGFSTLLANIRELWNEWEMRLLVLLSLFLQLTLVTLVRRRKFAFGHWLHVMIWTAYLSADSIAVLALGILSSHLAKIQEMMGTTNPKSQITAFWAPFLLLHLGGPDTITAYVQEDNELWLRQSGRLCIQVGLVCFIYFMALSGSTLSMLAAALVLVGFIKYAERILCLYLASKGRLRDSMLVLPNFIPIYPRIMQMYALNKEEGYQVRIDTVEDVLNIDDVPVETVPTLVKAYDLFNIFKLLFSGFIRRFGDLDASKHVFMGPHMDSEKAFGIVEIELGFMYDLLYTKAPLLNFFWGIIRWGINLSVLCAALVFFSLQDKKDYPKVDVFITFLLISVAILVEIYSLLLAISSDWVNHRWIQRDGKSAISSIILLFCRFWPERRWSNSVAQLSFLGLSVRKMNGMFLECCPLLAKLDYKLAISYLEFNSIMKDSIFFHMRETVDYLERENRLEEGAALFKLDVNNLLTRSNCEYLRWSLEGLEFDQSILIWHIATELCSYKDSDKMQGAIPEDVMAYRMSNLISRYMLYLTLVQPSMLPTGIGVLVCKDTLDDAQEFFEDKLAPMSKKGGIVSSAVIRWARKLLTHHHTVVRSCIKRHKSRGSRYLCELSHLLLQVKTDVQGNMRRTESRSVLFHACHLASQLNEKNNSDKWDLISKIWVRMLMYAARQCKGYEHCQSLSRGGELLSHIWLLMAHLGEAEAVQTFKPRWAYKLIKN